MYVRLKHTLSALALRALRHPERSLRAGAVPWLQAFCSLSEQGASTRYEVPVVAARAGASRGAIRSGGAHAGEARGLKAALKTGLLERHGRTLVLPDAFRPHFSYLTRQVDRLEHALRALTRRPRAHGRRATIQKGAALFNAGLFFECHELLEGAWQHARANERTFYHGVILVAAAFYHHEKGNLHGARIKLTEGMKHLQRLLPDFHGVALDRWLERLGPWKARLEAGQVPGVLRASEIPRIPLRLRPRAPVKRKRGL